MATRLPFIKFFPSDWMSDPKLRLCSIAARGLWVDMLCMMHANTSRRGFLEKSAGNSVSQSELARACGLRTSEAAKLLAELEAAGVFSKDEGGVIYSRRMVLEQEFREKCSAAGKKGGGNPNLQTFKGSPKVDPKASQSLRLQTSDAREKTKDIFAGVNPANDGEKIEPKPKATPKPKAPRARNPVFDAVAEVCGLDPVTAGSLIGKVSSTLAAANPPYTPEDVRAFAARFWEFCGWAARDSRKLPTPNELQTHIGRLRAAAPKPTAPKSNYNPMTDPDFLRTI